MGLFDKVKKEITGIKGYEDVIRMDRKILIPGIVIFALLAGGWYYYIFMVYPAHKQDVRDKAQQQRLYKTSPVRGNSNMAPSDTAGTSDPKKAADVFKIPANFMDMSAIPDGEQDMYLKSFDIVYDFVTNINAKSYDKILKMLDKDFVSYNILTEQHLSQYFTDVYFANNSFFIQKVERMGTSYVVQVAVINKDLDGSGFYATYKLINNKGKLGMIIDNIPAYFKGNLTPVGNQAPANTEQNQQIPADASQAPAQ